MSEAEVVRATRDLARTEPLAAAGTVSRQSLDVATAAAASAVAQRDAAREAVQLLRAGTRPERIQMMRAELANARASLAAAEAVAGDLVLIAPVGGNVLSRNAEPGEMLVPGQAAITLGETGAPYARVYIPTGAPLVHTGQGATARLDGFPDHLFRGRVVAISPTAEFTPRIALTEKERADLVFGVKVALEDTTGMLKAGLPATVERSTERHSNDRRFGRRRSSRARPHQGLRRSGGGGPSRSEDRDG